MRIMFSSAVAFAVVLCCFALYTPTVVDGSGTLYKVKNKRGKVCSLLEVDFNLTISARRSHSLLGRNKYTHRDEENVATGNCYDEVILHLKDGVTWNFRRYLDQSTSQSKMARTVTFVPYNLFGEATPSNKTLGFRNLRDAILGSPLESYSCDVEDREYYVERWFYDDLYSGINYLACVDVRFLQIQFRQLRNGQFSGPKKCEVPR